MALPDCSLLYYLFGLLTNKLFGTVCGMHSSGSTSALTEQPNMAGFSVITNAYGVRALFLEHLGVQLDLYSLVVVVLIVGYDDQRYDGL